MLYYLAIVFVFLFENIFIHSGSKINFLNKKLNKQIFIEIIYLHALLFQFFLFKKKKKS